MGSFFGPANKSRVYHFKTIITMTHQLEDVLTLRKVFSAHHSFSTKNILLVVGRIGVVKW